MLLVAKAAIRAARHATKDFEQAVTDGKYDVNLENLVGDLDMAVERVERIQDWQFDSWKELRDYEDL